MKRLLLFLLIAQLAFAGTVSNLDDLPDSGGGACTGACWHWSHDAGTPGTSSATSSLTGTIVGCPASRDGQARRFNFTWTAGGGTRTSVSLGGSHLDATATNFVYDVWFCVSDTGHVNQLEFDHNQRVSSGDTVILATQCNLTRGLWQYGTNVLGAAHWNDSSATCSRASVTSGVWHHVIITEHHNSDGTLTTHDTVSFDGHLQNFGSASGPSNFSLGDSPNGIQFSNFQLNGDSTSNSTIAYLDSMTITSSTPPNVPAKPTGLNAVIN